MDPVTRRVDLDKVDVPESDAHAVEGHIADTLAGRQRVADHPNTVERVNAAKLGISLDWLAVLIAIALALLVYAGLLPEIPW